jgi:hypothetical protein
MSRPEGAPSRLGVLFKALLCFALAFVLGLLAWLFLYGGFSSLRDMRQLERTPRSLAAGVLPGEVTLLGRTRVLDGTVQAPDSGTETLYYRYTVERKQKDSDGDTRWVTVTDRSEYRSFLLDDDSGAITIEPSGRVDFDVPARHSREAGDMRYTEHRLDPGDEVFVFGIAADAPGGPRVYFDLAGQYVPIISTYGEAAAHSGFSGATLVMLWIGLCILSLAIFAICWGLRVHGLLPYLATLSLAMAVALVLLSLQTARDDLAASFARTARDVESARAAIAARLDAAGLAWDGDFDRLDEARLPGFGRLDAAERRILTHLRARLALQIERTDTVRRQWPERVVAGSMTLPRLPEVTLPEGETQAAAQDPTGPVIASVLALFSLGLAALFAWLGFRRVKLKRTIENLATTRTAGVAYGLVELKGNAAVEEGSAALTGPLSERPCVWYRYLVEERRGSGKNRRWVTIEDRRVDRPFRVVDSEGSIPLDPKDAEAIVTCRRQRRDGDTRYTEHWIEPGTPLYVLGSATIDPRTASSLLLARGPHAQPFLLTDLEEPALMLRKARSGFLFLNFGTNFGNAAALSLLGASAALDGAGFLAAGLAPLVFFAVFLAVLMYNDLVTLRQRVRLTWSNIQVSLMKRADLVPQLESVLQAYLAHESGLQAQLTQMRSLASRGELDPAAAGQLVGAEQGVMARVAWLTERYPELKGSELAQQLSATLVRLDNEVALMREGYNNAVERYNSRSQRFPELLFAKAFGFVPASPFQADMSVHAVPQVESPGMALAAGRDGAG